MDRVNALKLDLVRIGRLKKLDVKRSINNLLDNQVNVLTSDEHPSIKAFSKDYDIQHEIFKAKYHKRKSYHVNTAIDLKNTVNNTLRGVSTKYLQSYLNWYKINELRKLIDLNVFDYVFSNHSVRSMYEKREKDYRQFITLFSNYKTSDLFV